MTRALLLVLSLLLLPMLSVQGQDAPETTDRPPPPVKWTYGLFGGAFKADLTVYQGGARDAAGEIVVTVKDRLTHWNGRAISNRDQFTLELFGTKPGEIVEITFERPNPDKKTVVSWKNPMSGPWTRKSRGSVPQARGPHPHLELAEQRGRYAPGPSAQTRRAPAGATQAYGRLGSPEGGPRARA